VGTATLQQFDETPDVMIERALTMREALATIIKPRILVHDEYRGVGDSLRLVFGADCDVTGSTNLEEASRLIQEQHFDAVLADLNSDGDGQELIARAKARNQAVQAFYLSSELPGSMRIHCSSGNDVPVFSKPFDVEMVRGQILSALASNEPVAAK
jgi:DNA-binding NtrC family response regulator